MGLASDRKYLIIAQKEYHSILYKLKEENPFLDFSLITPNNFYNRANFSINSDAINYLLKKEKDDYLMIQNKLSLLNKADLNLDKDLKNLFDELNNNSFIEYDPFFNIEIQKEEILLFEEKEDEGLLSFLKRKNLSFKHIDFNFINLKENKNICKPILFSSKLFQYLYIFSDIREKIINHSINPSKISILSNQEDDLFYLKLCSDIFNIDVDLTSFTPLLGIKEVNEFISNSFKEKKFDKSKINNSDLLNIFEKYKLDELKNFSFAYLNLLEIIKEYNIVTKHKDGIKVIQDFNISDDYIYVTNFQYDVFYRNYQNKGIYSEKELSNLGVNPSYVKTKMDAKFKKNYLLHSNIVHLSRIISTSSEKIYDSNFVEEELVDKYIKEDINNKGLYTSKAKEIILSTIKDDSASSSDNIYKSYSNKYKQIPSDIYRKEFNEKNKISATMLKNYFSCHYKYYIENLVSLPGYSYNLASLFGVLLHHIFESNYKDFNGLVEEIDFDSIYNEAKKKTIEENNVDDFTKELFALSKRYIEVSYKASLLQKKLNPNIYQNDGEIEYRFNYSLDNSKYIVTGQIDKIVRIKGSENNYYAIIDYKTNSSEYFDYQLVFLGGSLQLPIYYLALENNNLFSNDSFAGFFIHNIFSKKIITANKLELNHYKNKINGLYLRDIDFVRNFDIDATSGEKIKYKNPDGFLKTSSYFDKEGNLSKIEDYTFSDLIDDAKKSIFNLVHGIEKNDFKIEPRAKDNPDLTACKYCEFRDICFRRFDDIVLIKKEIQSKFGTYYNGEVESEE